MFFPTFFAPLAPNIVMGMVEMLNKIFEYYQEGEIH